MCISGFFFQGATAAGLLSWTAAQGGSSTSPWQMIKAGFCLLASEAAGGSLVNTATRFTYTAEQLPKQMWMFLLNWQGKKMNEIGGWSTDCWLRCRIHAIQNFCESLLPKNPTFYYWSLQSFILNPCSCITLPCHLIFTQRGNRRLCRL